MRPCNLQLTNSAQFHGSESQVKQGLAVQGRAWPNPFPKVTRRMLPECIFKLGNSYYIAEKEADVAQMAENVNRSYSRARIVDVLISRGMGPDTLRQMLKDCRDRKFEYKETTRTSFTRDESLIKKINDLGDRLPESKKIAKELVDNTKNFFKLNPPSATGGRPTISIIHSNTDQGAVQLKSPLAASLALYLKMLIKYPTFALNTQRFLTILAFESGNVVNQSLLEYGALLGIPKFHKDLTNKPLNFGISVSSSQVLMNTGMVNSVQKAAASCGVKLDAMPGSKDYNDPVLTTFLGMINVFNYVTEYAQKHVTRNIWGIYAGLAKADMLSLAIASNPMFLISPLGMWQGKRQAYVSAGVIKNDTTYNQVKNTYDRAVFERCMDYVLSFPEIPDK